MEVKLFAKLIVIVGLVVLYGTSPSIAETKKQSSSENSDGHHRKHRNKDGADDDSNDRHHGRNHRKVNNLDGDFTMEQVWTLPGLDEKQRTAIVEIERNFKLVIRPLRKEHRGIRNELRERDVEFTTDDAGSEIGPAVVNGVGVIDSDEGVLKSKGPETRTPDNLLTNIKARSSENATKVKGGSVSGKGSTVVSGKGSRLATKKSDNEKKLKGKARHKSKDGDDEEVPTYKTARNSALFNRMKSLRKQMRAEKESAWVRIRTVLTDKQKAVLAKK